MLKIYVHIHMVMEDFSKENRATVGLLLAISKFFNKSNLQKEEFC